VSVRTELEILKPDLARCLRCGICREVCPAFRATGDERHSPRGRIAMLAAVADGKRWGRLFRESLDYCLACKSCAEKCPSGVAGDLLVLAARADGHCSGGLPFLKSRVFALTLGRPGLMHRALRALSLIGKSGLLKRFSPLRPFVKLLGVNPDLPIPTVPKRSLDELVPKASAGAARGKVTYFAGCASRFVYPEIGLAVVKLLRKAGYEVEIPGDRVCCGIPALVNGDWDLARRLAEKNVAALGADGPIIVDCGSCGTALSEFYPDVLGAAGSERFAEDVVDVAEFVYREGGLEIPKSERTVTYHDPCHLARGLGVRDEPRALLSAAAEYVEAEDADRCCGGAGVYGATHPEVFEKIGAEKAANLLATGADTVATGCPACIYYLRASLASAGKKPEVRHTAEVLAERLNRK
jgi:glycolate oxidase iron-sulfur subunit